MISPLFSVIFILNITFVCVLIRHPLYSISENITSSGKLVQLQMKILSVIKTAKSLINSSVIKYVELRHVNLRKDILWKIKWVYSVVELVYFVP